MRIRIALGAVAGLAAVSAFVWLQFRAEALAQDVSPESSEPLPALSDPFESDISVVPGESAELIKPSDPFGDDSISPDRSESKSGQTVSSEPDGESYDPFAPASDETEAFGFDEESADDSSIGSNAFAAEPSQAPRPKHQLRIIRVENVPVEVTYSVVTSLFVTNGEGAEFF